ncbi:MAG: hypothetical protein KBS70_00475 [Bacteroidales bacterium]|nr:hypothetical protein [Candidatus Colicola equi]
MKRIIVVLDIMFFISSIFAHPVTSKIAVIMSDEKSTGQFLGNELDLGYPLMVKQTFLFSERLSDSLICFHSGVETSILRKWYYRRRMGIICYNAIKY